LVKRGIRKEAWGRLFFAGKEKSMEIRRALNLCGLGRGARGFRLIGEHQIKNRIRSRKRIFRARKRSHMRDQRCLAAPILTKEAQGEADGSHDVNVFILRLMF
jgi:hypothetical protein